MINLLIYSLINYKINTFINKNILILYFLPPFQNKEFFGKKVSVENLFRLNTIDSNSSGNKESSKIIERFNKIILR